MARCGDQLRYIGSLGRRAPGDRPREGRARIVVDFDVLDDVAGLLEPTVGVERVAAEFRPTKEHVAIVYE